MADIMSPQQEHQPQREQSGSRAPSRAPSRNDSLTSDSEQGSQLQRRRRGGRKQQSGDLPGLDEVEDTGRAVTNTANQVGRAGQQAVQGGSSASDDRPLKLRLDLNIDVDIHVKATVHGDITLSLLR